MTEDDFLRSILNDPDSPAETWLVLADWLEERGDPRGELVRLCHDPAAWRDITPSHRDDRVRQLLASGIRPCMPTVVNSLGMRLVLIPAGAFLMGSSLSEPGHYANESPRHEVEISRPFLLGVFPVTQQEYQKLIGRNPSYFTPGRGRGAELGELDTRLFPADSVAWEDANEFCRRLSALPAEEQAGRAYRLPTEAEWEYACRGGAAYSTPFHFGPRLSLVQANFDGNDQLRGPPARSSLQRTTAVGSYPPNTFGLYDLHGNVREWCSDLYGERYYGESPRRDPQGPRIGVDRVARGGSWNDPASYCRSACRFALGEIDYPVYCSGFRIVCVTPHFQNASPKGADGIRYRQGPITAL